MGKSVDSETAIKMNIYQTILETTKVPSADEVARFLGVSIDEVVHAFQNLHQKRLLVAEPDEPMKIRMAPPFSGIEAQFAVRMGEKTSYANCAWDALGVPAALHNDAVVETTDAQTGEVVRIHVRDQRPIAQDCAIHFAVPAVRWWDDIVYT